MSKCLRLLACTLYLFAGSLNAEQGEVGDRYDQLEVKGRTYTKVQVKQITPQGLIIFHSRGISKLPFSDLSPELQTKYSYDPAAEAQYLEQREQAEAITAATQEKQPKQSAASKRSEAVLNRFGSAPSIENEIDLRPQFNALNLYVKDQGRRPSCAIFAVVSALEYENAKNSGKAEKLSEEYLIWATRKSLGVRHEYDSDYDPDTDGDLGFNLIEVVQALRRYGIPDADSMPNTFGKAMARIEEPDDTLIKEARERRKVSATYITGRKSSDKINNIIHALNSGTPVVIGLDWPHSATLRSVPLLSKQAPQYGHAVTLVGYKNDTGKPEDTRFLFKNSWGPEWGINGHGWITYEYLEKNLTSAAIVGVQ